MTDERFDQILKQALTPQNKASELKIKKRVRTYGMNKLMKRGIAVAACAVICLCGYYATNHLNADNQNGVLDTTLTKVSEAFTIKVQAAELTGDNLLPISVTKGTSDGYVLGSSEDAEGTIYYCINLPLSCEGENIKNVTYSINKGCFQIVEPADTPYVVDYIEHTGDDTNFGQCGGFDDEELNPSQWREEKVMYLDSFTVDYDKQTGDEFWTNIGNVVPNMQEAYDLIWNDDSADNDAKAHNMLLSDVEITVTVTFEDGAQSSKVLGLESKVVDVDNDKGSDKIAEIFVKEL